MIYRDYERIFRVRKEPDVGLVAFSPLANDLLSDRYGKGSATRLAPATDYRASMPQFSDEAFDTNQELFEQSAA